MSVAAALVLATAAPIEATWSLEAGTRHRWSVETEMNFPGHAWVFADRNLDVRAHNLGLQAIVDCVAEAPRTRVGKLSCVLEDVAVTGSTFPGQYGRLQPVLEELDTKLTGAPLVLTLTHDGRVRDVDFVPNRVSPFENRRTRETDAFLRMIVVRAIAPLDFGIPDRGFPTTTAWSDPNRLTFAMPVTWGSAGSGRIAHRAQRHDDARVLIESRGRALMVPSGFVGGGKLMLKGDLEGYTVFDVQTGRVAEAAWTTVATPTASSGPLARPYSAISTVKALEVDEAPPLTETFEWVPGAAAPRS